MTKTAKIVAKGMAEQADIETLLKEKEKSSRLGVREAIDDELEERNWMCPNCENNLMKNETEGLFYCPAGHYEVEV